MSKPAVIAASLALFVSLSFIPQGGRSANVIVASAVPDLAVTVTDWSNINRTNEPVTAGIPVPTTAIGLPWALYDGAQQIPLQTTDLPGRKTPWVLLDFQSTISAGATKTYTLKQQTPTANPDQPVVITENANQITVSTGPIRTQLSKTSFNLFDTVWRDQNADGVFEAGETVVSPLADNLTITDTSIANGGTELEYSAVVQATDIEWEYQGPLRATLRIEGRYENPLSTLPNQTLLFFTTRLTWYAGQTQVKIDHLLRNSFAAKEHWAKLASAKLNAGTSTTTDRIAKSGDVLWSNRPAGTSLELIPPTLDISDEYDPYGTPPVERLQYNPPINIDANGGMIIGDQSYHGATIHIDFAAALSGPESTRRTTAAKDPLIALAPESRYSELGAFGSERFGTYTDEKNTYAKWGWTWPNAGPQFQWSEEHNRPRVQDMYMTWSTTMADDFEADELWQNIMMLARVRIPYFLDRLRSYARFWNWEWTYRSDGYEFNGSWHWFYGNGIVRTPAIQPTLTAADSDFIAHNVKLAKADATHNWNGGSIDYYYLTGDQDSLRAAIDMAEQCYMSFYGPNYDHTPQNTGVSGTGSRYTIRCLYIFTRTWEATNNVQWKTAADGLLPFFLESPRYDPRGFFYSSPCLLPGNDCLAHPNGKSFAGFPTAVAVEALYRYYLLTDHQGVRTQLLQIAEFMRDHALDPMTGFGGTNYIIDSPFPGNVVRTADIYGRTSRDFVNAMVIGYRLTNDNTYLEKAKLAWGRGTKGVQGSEYATDNQVGRWESSLQAWNPYSALFPEGGDLTYTSLLFSDAVRIDETAPAAIVDLQAD